MIDDRLELRPDGVLVASHWDATNKTFKETNVTHLAPALLFETTTLASGVTLKDVFLLIDQHKELLCGILGNWAEEFVAEGLTNYENPSDLDALILTWNVRYRKEPIAELSGGLHFPELHGVDAKQQRYGLSFSNASKLSSVSLRLDHTICFQNEDEPDCSEELIGATFTLGSILYGVIWELSFYGPPKVRDAKAQELEKRIEKAKEDPSSLISWEEVKERMLKRGQKNAAE